MRNRTLAIFLTLLLVFSLMTGMVSAASFTDVPASEYYAKPVAWAVQAGVTTGTSDTTFSPDSICTRGQMVTFLWRASGMPAAESQTSVFKDVNVSDYFFTAVLWAAEKGITLGTAADTFSPNDTVTRGQTVTFLWRLANKPAVTAANPFADVAADAFYAPAVLWAVSEGITTGTAANAFSPDSGCTRGQIVTFLYRDIVEAAPAPTTAPTTEPTVAPTAEPTVAPTVEPTVAPTVEPTTEPTVTPTAAPVTDTVYLLKTVTDTTDWGDGETQTLSWNYIYDEHGNNVKVETSFGYTVTRTFRDNGEVEKEILSTESSAAYTTTTFTYDDQGRVLTSTYMDSADSYLRFSYQYGADGNVATMAFTQHYGDYESVQTYTYSYDSHGNMTGWTVSGGDLDSMSFELTYDDQGRVVTQKSFFTYTNTYDDNGNLVKVVTTGPDGRQTNVTTYTYEAFDASKLPSHWQGEVDMDPYMH